MVAGGGGKGTQCDLRVESEGRNNGLVVWGSGNGLH